MLFRGLVVWFNLYKCVLQGPDDLRLIYGGNRTHKLAFCPLHAPTDTVTHTHVHSP